jgi:hypothetical protein
MTAYTSLVAVDSEVSNWTGSSTPVMVPVEMPEDVSYEGNFGVTGKGKSMQVALPWLLSAPPPARALGYSDEAGAARGRGEGSRERRSDSVGGPAGTVPRRSLPGPAEALPGSDPAREKDDRIDAAIRKEAGESFTRVVVVLPDGTEYSVESDGELWRIQGKRRTLLSSISPAEMAEFHRLLAAARAGSWTGGGSSGRILYEAPGISRAASLPSSEPSIQALADWIRLQGR